MIRTFQAFLATLTFYASFANADVNVRRVSYINLPAMEAQPDLTPASDPDCQGPDPFANADWKNTGLVGGCPTGRIPPLVFYVGSKVPAFATSNSTKPVEVAILTIEEINTLRSLHPGATFRFELKASGYWSRYQNSFMPVSLFPSSSCVSSNRFTEIQRMYSEKGLDWRKNWYFPRTKFAFGAPDYKAYQSELIGPHGFSHFFYYDFDMNECDAPLTLKLTSQNYASIKLDLLEANIYVCSSSSACSSVARLFD